MTTHRAEGELELDHRYKILLVEDSPSDAELTAMAFEEGNVQAEIFVVQDGERALDFLYQRDRYQSAPRPDLILLDLNLPRKNGHEVLVELKHDPLLRPIPVAILSTSDADHDISRSYELGANCYLVKPVDYDQFISLLQGVGRFWFDVTKLSPKTSHAVVAPCLPSIRCSKSGSSICALIVEDNAADVDLLTLYLEESEDCNFVVERANRLSQAIDLAQHRAVDVVLLDLGLPDSQGIATFERFQAAVPHVAVVVQSGSDDRATASQAVRLGAQDYLPKGNVDAYSLSRALLYAIERKEYEKERGDLMTRERAARIEAERAVFARDEFLSIASHEFKTPITALSLQAERLLLAVKRADLGPSAEKIERFAVRMGQQAERLNRLTGNLLDASRIDRALQLEPKEMDLGALVEDTLTQLQGQIEASDCKISLHITGNTRGQWDFFRLEQVVVNLLSNALKYGRSHPVEVYVAGPEENETDPTASATFQVQDHGIGIAQADQGRIFRRFERAVGTQQFEGLGLGLFIVRQIVEAHGGTIGVTSHQGEGSCFTVALPSAAAIASQAVAAAS